MPVSGLTGAGSSIPLISGRVVGCIIGFPARRTVQITATVRRTENLLSFDYPALKLFDCCCAG